MGFEPMTFSLKGRVRPSATIRIRPPLARFDEFDSTPVLPLDEFVRPQLDHYLDEHRVGPDDPDAALITTRRGQPFTEHGLYQVFKRLKILSGVRALCPHALRHYWTEHYDGDLTDIMIEGGWNSVAMVKRYRGNRARDRSRTSTLANALSFTPKRRSSRQGDGFRLLHGTGAG